MQTYVCGFTAGRYHNRAAAVDIASSTADTDHQGHTQNDNNYRHPGSPSRHRGIATIAPAHPTWVQYQPWYTEKLRATDTEVIILCAAQPCPDNIVVFKLERTECVIFYSVESFGR